MENASKALLIAGAILLVIALIAIGMMVLGQGSQTVEQTASTMSALSVQAENQLVSPYMNRTLTSNEFDLLKSGAARLKASGLESASYKKNGKATATSFDNQGRIRVIEYK